MLLGINFDLIYQIPILFQKLNINDKLLILAKFLKRQSNKKRKSYKAL